MVKQHHNINDDVNKHGDYDENTKLRGIKIMFHVAAENDHDTVYFKLIQNEQEIMKMKIKIVSIKKLLYIVETKNRIREIESISMKIQSTFLNIISYGIVPDIKT